MSRPPTAPPMPQAAWRATGARLAALPAHQVRAAVRDAARTMRHWSEDVRTAEAGDPDCPWWALGRRGGTHGTAAALVRRLVAGIDDILALPGRSGWRRHLDRRCVWRPDLPADLAPGRVAQVVVAARAIGASALDLSEIADRAHARDVFLAVIADPDFVRLRRLDAPRIDPPGRAPPAAAGGRLRVLDIGYNRLAGSLGAWVAGLASPGGLRDLRIGGNDAGPADLAFLSRDGFLPELIRLDLGPNAVDGEAVRAHFAASPPCQLRALVLSDIGGLESHLGAIVAREMLPRLTCLGLNTAVRPRVVADLLSSGSLDRVRYIDLRGAWFEEADVAAFSAVRRPAGLTLDFDPRDVESGLAELRAWLGGADRAAADRPGPEEG